jgi:DNA polymerase I-like protein with 3'-5' exonuclease and polymerase domains
VDRDDAAGEYCRKLIDYSQAEKLTSTYIGKEAEDTGLWQYIAPNGRIYPSYKLHATNTGRTASENPNGQNFPKRGRWAKAYQSVFVPTPGYKLINADLSQIELRIAAWMSGDRMMLDIYGQGGDIHTATARAVNGLDDAAWAALSKDERKLARTKAKAVNFGFLYGMGAKKFRSYAKTDYGVEYTEREAYQTREKFFATYRALPAWHDRMREFARTHGYVRALHGARRNLPSIWSKDDAIRSGAERQAINAPVQRFGSDLGVMAMARFSACADPDIFRIIGFVHDALVMEVREGYEKGGVEALIWAMQNNPLERWFGITPPLPILAEGDIGINGREMLELSELPPLEKQPQWFRDLGLPLVTRDGKLAADLTVQKPAWWNDAVDEAPLEEFAGLAETH